MEFIGLRTRRDPATPAVRTPRGLRNGKCGGGHQDGPTRHDVRAGQEILFHGGWPGRCGPNRPTARGRAHSPQNPGAHSNRRARRLSPRVDAESSSRRRPWTIPPSRVSRLPGDNDDVLTDNAGSFTVDCLSRGPRLRAVLSNPMLTDCRLARGAQHCVTERHHERPSPRA